MKVFPEVKKFTQLNVDDLFTFSEDFVLFPVGLCQKMPNQGERGVYIAMGNFIPLRSKQYMVHAGYDPECIRYTLIK